LATGGKAAGKTEKRVSTSANSGTEPTRDPATPISVKDWQLMMT